MDKLLKDLEIDETYTRPIKKQKVFNNIRNRTVQKEDYNMMADLLELPTTSKGYKYLFVIVDLFSREFDIEPIKNKEASTVLNAMKKCFTRDYVKSPYSSLRTDDGSEFKGVFHKYLYDNNILHKRALPYRKTQLATVEALNKQLGRLLNGYMNTQEERTGETFRDWDKIVPKVREALNEIRRDVRTKEYPVLPNNVKPKYKVGDVVYYTLDYPEDALGNKQDTKDFRVGDYRWSQDAKKVIEVIPFTDKPYFRYLLEGRTNASYSDNQLKIAEEETETTYKVKKIIGKRKEKNKIQYLVWFDKEKKEDALWINRTELLKDGLVKMLSTFEKG